MSELNSLKGFQDRFWYWQGKSGTRYIHSIYAPDACPPLPGAIFIAVQRLTSGKRVALEVGRFCTDWDYVDSLISDYRVGFSLANEIHVHLLAKSDDNAIDVVNDLEAGIGPRPVVQGFHEESGTSAGTSASTLSWSPALLSDQGADNILASF